MGVYTFGLNFRFYKLLTLCTMSIVVVASGQNEKDLQNNFGSLRSHKGTNSHPQFLTHTDSEDTNVVFREHLADAEIVDRKREFITIEDDISQIVSVEKQSIIPGLHDEVDTDNSIAQTNSNIIEGSDSKVSEDSGKRQTFNLHRLLSPQPNHPLPHPDNTRSHLFHHFPPPPPAHHPPPHPNHPPPPAHHPPPHPNHPPLPAHHPPPHPDNTLSHLSHHFPPPPHSRHPPPHPNHPPPFGVQDNRRPNKTKGYCPSFCMSDYTWLPSKDCHPPTPHCCYTAHKRLHCCDDKRLAIDTTNIGEDYLCPSPLLRWWNDWWPVVLGTILSVAMVTLIASVGVCVCQIVKNRKKRNMRRSHSINSTHSFQSECSVCRNAIQMEVVNDTVSQDSGSLSENVDISRDRECHDQQGAARTIFIVTDLDNNGQHRGKVLEPPPYHEIEPPPAYEP